MSTADVIHLHGVAGGSQRRGSVASPVMIGISRKCAGNHPLYAESPRQGATHRLDRCIVAPYPSSGIGRIEQNRCAMA